MNLQNSPVTTFIDWTWPNLFGGTFNKCVGIEQPWYCLQLSGLGNTSQLSVLFCNLFILSPTIVPEVIYLQSTLHNWPTPTVNIFTFNTSQLAHSHREYIYMRYSFNIFNFFIQHFTSGVVLGKLCEVSILLGEKKWSR